MYFKPSSSCFLSNYCVLDLETTGLNPLKSEIIEVGIVKIRNNKPVEKMETLIRPARLPIPSFITQLTGITSKELESAPTFEQVEPWLWHFIGDDPILGYNVLFDLGFIREHSRTKTDCKNTFLDILPLAQISFPNMESHSLSSMTSALNLYQNSHRAIDDCFAAWQVYDQCKEKLAGKTGDEISQMILEEKERRKARREAQKAARQKKSRTNRRLPKKFARCLFPDSVFFFRSHRAAMVSRNRI